MKHALADITGRSVRAGHRRVRLPRAVGPVGILEPERGCFVLQSIGAGSSHRPAQSEKEVPPGFTRLADPYNPTASEPYQSGPAGLNDLSYYKGRLYLYFGVTPALILFWPFVALTGHCLFHRLAVLVFCSIGFLASVGVLYAAWRRYFSDVGVWVVAAGALALGLATVVPVILPRSDVYEVAISCGYMLTMLALGAISARRTNQNDEVGHWPRQSGVRARGHPHDRPCCSAPSSCWRGLLQPRARGGSVGRCRSRPSPRRAHRIGSLTLQCPAVRRSIDWAALPTRGGPLAAFQYFRHAFSGSIFGSIFSTARWESSLFPFVYKIATPAFPWAANPVNIPSVSLRISLSVLVRAASAGVAAGRRGIGFAALVCDGSRLAWLVACRSRWHFFQSAIIRSIDFAPVLVLLAVVRCSDAGAR